MSSFRIFVFLIVILLFHSCSKEPKRILVFSKTAEFRHESIEAGKIALIKLGMENGFQVDTTEDSSYFAEEILKDYKAVVFLNTTGDVLDDPQQADFERYIQAGGGYVGIHSATDTEYDWDWYNKLAGAYFNGHPDIQPADLRIVNFQHPATEGVDSIWKKREEWYNFKQMNPAINVLMKIDEDSYEGGTHGGNHPMAWYHEYDGGRAFYTGLGHLSETYKDPIFLRHLLGGIEYTMSDKPLDYQLAHTKRVPEENRFSKEVLDFNLHEPMEMDEIPGRGILLIERTGTIKLYDFAEEAMKKIGHIDVYHEDEDGLLGLAVDPDFNKNNWIYLFYSDPGANPEQHISRFEMKGDSIDFTSEKIILTIPTMHKCCHSGGSLEFDKDGNLWIGVGDNTNPFESEGYAPIDERPGRKLWDAQRSASNTNDLRGKILRITPQADGTYSIPEGNLFPEGTPKTRPEIYAMGLRNPFRFSIDSKTNYLYWGDVGPDAGRTDSLRGPHGMGEFNQARKAAYWGWPYTRGNNQVYNDYDFASKISGQKFDPENIINDSPNNTGLKELPDVQPSLIWYSYGASEEFPWLGEGGVNPMAGPVYHASDYPNAKNYFPDYFENKLFVYEWMRDWIYVVTLDENQDYVKAEAFMPNTEFSHPMDMLFGSDGNLYVLKYGQKWYAQNIDARLSKIRYIQGNRPPLAKITADKEVGAAPLAIRFSAVESEDYDKDELTYEWIFEDGKEPLRGISSTYTYREAGVYEVQLKVTDALGESATAKKKIMVGNDPPQLKITVGSSDLTYWDNKEINYQITVEDTEDGSTEDETIDLDRVKVTMNYLPEGEDLILATVGHQQNAIPKGLELINGSDCKACHAKDVKVNGPSYIDISKKYTKEDQDYLVSTIIKGGSGVWGETLMSAHPQLDVEDVETIVQYILSLDPNEQPEEKILPLSGSFVFDDHLKDDDPGKYILMASYRDNGLSGQDDFALSASEQLIFTVPKLQAEDADERSDGLGIWDSNGYTLVGSIAHNTLLKFSDQTLKGVKNIRLAAKYNEGYNYQGMMEIREQSPSGNVIGKVQLGYYDENEWAMKYYDIPVQPTIDKGDLFLVFKNLKDETQFILNADWILLER